MVSETPSTSDVLRSPRSESRLLEERRGGAGRVEGEQNQGREGLEGSAGRQEVWGGGKDALFIIKFLQYTRHQARRLINILYIFMVTRSL